MKKTLFIIALLFLTTPAHAGLRECVSAFNNQQPMAYEACKIEAEKEENMEAQKIVGDMYYWGWGDVLPKDYDQAVIWYKRAAMNGSPEAKFSIGVLYEQGLGVPADFAMAFKWYKSAAEDGNVEAQFNLGNIYSKGAGVPQNQDQAFMWYKRAAEQGDRDSQYNLGNRYATGNGVEQNLVEAYKWYSLAANAGDGDANKSIEVISSQMLPEQIEKAKLDAANWRPKLE